MSEELTFISICGLLGYGYPLESLDTALQFEPDFIGVDAGSTDPGPYYLGHGVGFVKPQQVRRDLEPALCAAVERGIPLIVGSAGGSGAAPHLRDFVVMVEDIARQRGLSFNLATISADVGPETVIEALEQGRIEPCGPVPELTAESIRSCTHIVGQMGTEPIIRALQAGAQVVVAGRCCDTAIFSALPIMRGYDPALALHAAKIAECGTICARPGGANDSLICAMRSDGFVVTPANPDKACYPDSVAAHSLYEQPDPHCFYEPEGMVDMRHCSFEPCGERGVSVTGTRLVPAERYTIKLEGAALRGYRSITVAGIRDPATIANLDTLEQGVQQAVADSLAALIQPDRYSLRFIRYGLDGVMGPLEPPLSRMPHEVGLVIEAVAPTQELADTVISLARSTALHQPFEMRKTTAGNLAFPFSPSDLSAGAVYEFAVYHLMAVDSTEELFPVTLRQVKQ